MFRFPVETYSRCRGISWRSSLFLSMPTLWEDWPLKKLPAGYMFVTRWDCGKVTGSSSDCTGRHVQCVPTWVCPNNGAYPKLALYPRCLRFNAAMEIHHLSHYKASINGPFSIPMWNNQRVYGKEHHALEVGRPIGPMFRQMHMHLVVPMSIVNTRTRRHLDKNIATGMEGSEEDARRAVWSSKHMAATCDSHAAYYDTMSRIFYIL